jgi:hypothetical protein
MKGKAAIENGKDDDQGYDQQVSRQRIEGVAPAIAPQGWGNPLL